MSTNRERSKRINKRLEMYRSLCGFSPAAVEMLKNVDVELVRIIESLEDNEYAQVRKEQPNATLQEELRAVSD